MGDREDASALRFLGYLIDLVPTVSVSVPLFWLPIWCGRIVGVAVLGWWLLRDVGGASLGKRLLHLRVVDAGGGPASTILFIIRRGGGELAAMS